MLPHCPQDMAPWLPPIPALTPSYASSHPLSLSDAYHPYTHIVPQYMPPTPPSPLLTLPPTCLILSAAYCP
ncbi:hypothetical protein O181_001348 [Austropuccinia psidii MF-1]|uniref:Uncharacterized protein n=1 Tax=Austropuccinia psidii MF-1 TaxID=1389203 RepID=A0A9Q3GBM4_9BASI|nr:hypothetical protein [Austropuccinia psidii MF-1]